VVVPVGGRQADDRRPSGGQTVIEFPHSIAEVVPIAILVSQSEKGDFLAREVEGLKVPIQPLVKRGP